MLALLQRNSASSNKKQCLHITSPSKSGDVGPIISRLYSWDETFETLHNSSWLCRDLNSATLPSCHTLACWLYLPLTLIMHAIPSSCFAEAIISMWECLPVLHLHACAWMYTHTHPHDSWLWGAWLCGDNTYKDVMQPLMVLLYSFYICVNFWFRRAGFFWFPLCNWTNPYFFVFCKMTIIPFIRWSLLSICGNLQIKELI